MEKNLNMQQTINDLRVAIILDPQDPRAPSSSGGETSAQLVAGGVTSVLWKPVGSAFRP